MLRTLTVLPLILFLTGIALAQESPAVVATPGVSGAAPEAASSAAAPAAGMERPAQGASCWRTIHIVRQVIKAILALSASFAFIALGIFLLRRSSPR
jgi:hypothetical protein